MESVVGGRVRVMTWISGGNSALAGGTGKRPCSRRCARLIPMSSHSRRYGGVMRRRKRTSSRRALGLFAGFAEPSYPAVPDPPQLADHEGITLGLGVLSRWPITSMRPVGTPGRG